MSPNKVRVIPFVRDESNVILIELNHLIEQSAVLSLSTALKQGIEAEYQLEGNELALDILPNIENPQVILFYESAEGGAGVLRRILEDPKALGQVAKTALEICHYDPALSIDDGDFGKAHGTTETCEAACYDCLLSYSNQYVHHHLDRHQAAEWLYALRDATVKASPSHLSRDDHMQRLLNLCESDLEEKWLMTLADHNLRLPDDAQVYFEECNTRIDFVYRERNAAIYIDGIHHDNPSQQEQDMDITLCLENLGATVIRFRYNDDWEALFKQYSDIFGGV